jgi:hypothetical protein
MQLHDTLSYDCLWLKAEPESAALPNRDYWRRSNRSATNSEALSVSAMEANRRTTPRVTVQMVTVASSAPAGQDAGQSAIFPDAVA